MAIPAWINSLKRQGKAICKVPTAIKREVRHMSKEQLLKSIEGKRS
jgi:hypothetical protein